MIAHTGRWCFTHRWATLGIWVAVMVGVFAVAGAVGPGFQDLNSLPDSESGDGLQVLEENFGAAAGGIQNGNLVFVADQGVADPQVQAAMEPYLAEIAAIDGVGSVVSPYGPLGARQVAAQGPLAGDLAYATINLDQDVEVSRAVEIGREINEKAPELAGLRTELGGQVFAEFVPPNSELIGLAFAVIVLILAFGSVLAMGLPIGVALGGVGTGAGLIILISNVMSVPEFATSIGAMIGLGVGIDYALFIVTRYREGLHEGRSPLDATSVAMDTAGRAVLFAGMTVVISLLGMILVNLPFVTGLAVAASTTVAVTVLASTTLLPAFLGFARERVEVTRWRGLIAAGLVAVALVGAGLKISALTIGIPLAVVVVIAGLFVPALKAQVPERKRKPTKETTAYRWSRLVQAHPWAAALVGVAALLVLAIPALNIHLGFSDEGNFPEESSARQAYDLLAEGFGPGFNGPFTIATAVDSPDDLATLGQLTQALSSTPGVAFASPPVPNDPADPGAAIIQVVPTTSPQDRATGDLVEQLRSSVVPQAVAGTGLEPKVTGFVPIAVDFSSYLAGRTPVFFGAVLALSFLLLMVVFRSLLVPLKAVIMNVLALGAAYGVTVAVFQWGWGASLLGTQGGPIEPFLPMMIFAIVFGLSMDYEVFLLSRIREEYDISGDAEESVADGLAATARVITAAAAIMVVVFGAFLFEDTRVLQVFGLGLAVAVLLDATLIRMLLVPATMELLGERNWWLPGWLDRILPNISVEGPSHAGDVVDVSTPAPGPDGDAGHDDPDDDLPRRQREPEPVG